MNFFFCLFALLSNYLIYIIFLSFLTYTTCTVNSPKIITGNCLSNCRFHFLKLINLTFVREVQVSGLTNVLMLLDIAIFSWLFKTHAYRYKRISFYSYQSF